MSLTKLVSLVLSKSPNIVFDVIYNAFEDAVLVERDNWEHSSEGELRIKTSGIYVLIPIGQTESIQLVLDKHAQAMLAYEKALAAANDMP